MDEVRRHIDVLEALIARSGKSKREIERRAGWAKSSLTKLLKGQWEIKLRQVLELLAAIDVAPLIFFRLVYRDLPLPDRLSEELGEGGPVPVLLPPAMTEEELDRRIEEAVERIMRREGGGSSSGA